VLLLAQLCCRGKGEVVLGLAPVVTLYSTPAIGFNRCHVWGDDWGPNVQIQAALIHRPAILGGRWAGGPSSGGIRDPSPQLRQDHASCTRSRFEI
jgi:hypothetical protein